MWFSSFLYCMYIASGNFGCNTELSVCIRGGQEWHFGEPVRFCPNRLICIASVLRAHGTDDGFSRLWPGACLFTYYGPVFTFRHPNPGIRPWLLLGNALFNNIKTRMFRKTTWSDVFALFPDRVDSRRVLLSSGGKNALILDQDLLLTWWFLTKGWFLVKLFEK